MDNSALLTRQQLLFGISPDEAQRQIERERAKDDARERTLRRFRDYAEKNSLRLLSDRVAELMSKPRALPAAPVTDDVSVAAQATGGVAPEAVIPPSAPVAPAEPAAPPQAPVTPPAPVEPPVAPPVAPAAPVAPEAPVEPPTPPAPETPTPAPANPVPESGPAAPTDDAQADASAPAAPTAASLVDNSGSAGDAASDDTPTNPASDNEV
jgi:hypothetical protein